MAVQKEQAVRAIEAFLRALGRDPERETELQGTADRVVDAWACEFLDGYDVDPAALLQRDALPLDDAPSGMVAVHGLAVCTMCPHHLLPALGTADVVFLPGARLVGFGTLARLVDAWSHRLTLQETVGQHVVASLLEHVGARGAACHLRLSHACMTTRSARQTGSFVETLALGGCFEGPGPERDLALSLLRTQQP